MTDAFCSSNKHFFLLKVLKACYLHPITVAWGERGEECSIMGTKREEMLIQGLQGRGNLCSLRGSRRGNPRSGAPRGMLEVMLAEGLEEEYPRSRALGGATLIQGPGMLNQLLNEGWQILHIRWDLWRLWYTSMLFLWRVIFGFRDDCNSAFTTITTSCTCLLQLLPTVTTSVTIILLLLFLLLTIRV